MQRLITVPKQELESLVETLETLENKDVVIQLEESEKDIIEGRIRKARKFLEEL